MEYNNEEQHGKISPIILTIIIIQIIFVVSIIILIINILKQDNKIESRDDQSKISIIGLPEENLSLPNSYIDDIAISLTDIIELNNMSFDYSNTKAIVRDNSVNLEQFKRSSFNALSFIVDIPEVEQSYQVYYKYPIDTDIDDTPFYNNPRAILCIDEQSEIIYPNFNCKSSYQPDIRQRIATDYIKFMEFDTFSIAIDDSDPTQININPIVDVTNEIAKEYITQVKTSIQNLGISPELFKYHVIQKASLNYDNSY